MEVLTSNKRLALLEYLPVIRYTADEWLFVELRLHETFDKDLSIMDMAQLLSGLFKGYDGRIYVCNRTEILMLIQWGKKGDTDKVAREIKFHLPPDTCEVQIMPSTTKGLAKLELLLLPSKATQNNPLYMPRTRRRENLILVADDDMYMRTLIKRGLADVGNVSEAAVGDEVAPAYQAGNPDVVFLDIHLPGKSGHTVLQEILKIDPDAYVVMVSADSSQENVKAAIKEGAKDFLTKPFTKERLLDCLKHCPTIY